MWLFGGIGGGWVDIDLFCCYVFGVEYDDDLVVLFGLLGVDYDIGVVCVCVLID